MSRVEETKCPACGAPMEFDIKTQQLTCSFCGTTLALNQTGEAEMTAAQAKELAEKKGEVSGFDLKDFQDKVIDPNAEPLPVYHCQSCGADLISDWEQISLTCPYCGNHVVLTDKVSGNLRPDGIVPFKITSDELPAAVDRFYKKKKKMISRHFFRDAKIGTVTGIYVPFWIFSGHLSGPVHYTGITSTTRREGDYKVTTDRYYDIYRNISLDFEGLPVDAGKDFDDAVMDTLEPFDLTQAVAFDKAYLAGFAADRFDVNGQSIANRARNRMLATAYAAARSTVSGYAIRSSTGNIKAELEAKYMLLPIYLFNITSQGKTYSYAVNGQTGKVVGALPDDKKAKIFYYLSRLLSGAAVLCGITAIRYFMGL